MYVKYLIIINYQSLELCCEIRLRSVWRSLFINVYKCDVIMTSSAAMNTQFQHCQNLPFLRYIHCNFCLNLLIIHRDMKENVSGCLFSEHSVESQNY